MALSTLVSEKSNVTAQTIKNLQHLIDYLGKHPDATIRYYASDMILNFHSDAFYLSARDAMIQAAGHLLLGCKSQDKHPIIHVLKIRQNFAYNFPPLYIATTPHQQELRTVM